jgi:tRNA nucleotidyltransferase (CCA-adding enzyme)
MKMKVPEKIAKKIPKEVWNVFKKFTHKGHEIYLVGAGVRDLLQEKTPVDCDFTTNATPAVIQALFKDSFYDNVFGTVGLSLKTQRGEEVYEITTYRTEWGYSDRRRPDQVKWGKKLEEDLQRRDFTFNAVVIGPILTKGKWDGKSLALIDLFGGQKDFQKKIVRAVGKPEERFAEDALRMMRAVRFASQLGFTIETKTLRAIKKNASLIKKISQERIRDELFKILTSPYPGDGYLILRHSGLAAQILPETERMFGVEQKSPGRHHLDDVGTHAVKSLAASQAADPIVNLAILLHDVGKPVVAGRDKKGTITFYNHEVVGASIARNIAWRLKFAKKDRERLFTLVRRHQFTVDERQTDKAIRRFIRHVGKANLADILEVRRADRIGGGARETSWRLERFKKKLIEVQKQPFSVTDLKVTGHDVMKILGLHPGPLVGKVLKQLYKEVTEEKSKNKREYLLKRLKTLGKSLLKSTKS